jgi:hypothetical protein
MRLTFERDVDIKCYNVAQEQAVRDAVTTCPRLLTAAMITEDMGFPSSHHDIIILQTLLEDISPRWPNEVCDPVTLASMLKHDVHFCQEEYEILKDLLPDTHDLLVKITAWEKHFKISFDVSPKHGGHFQVVFTGDGGACFPIHVMAQRWCDMDDPASHCEECPMIESEGASDCDCEPYVVEGDDLTVKSFKEWEDGGKEKIGAMIHRVVGF